LQKFGRFVGVLDPRNGFYIPDVSWDLETLGIKTVESERSKQD